MLTAELEAAAAIPACLGKCVHCGKDDFEGGGAEEEEEKEEENENKNRGAKAKTKKKKSKEGDGSSSSFSSFGPRTMILCTCCQVRIAKAGGRKKG